MFTQCPQCKTVFRVTAAMLKAAQGRVRCGRCAHVFNALMFLIEQNGAAPAEPSRSSSPAAPAERPPTSTPAEPAGGEWPLDDAGVDSGEIPESALEFTADDLSKVFVVAPAPTLASRPGPEPPQTSANDEDTAEHEILDIELETPEAPEVITLEGDSVILGEEDPSVSAQYFIEEEAPDEGRSLDEPRAAAGAAAPEVAARADAPVKKVAQTREAIDAEVQREIEAAFAADPSTRAEFTLPSGRRLEIGRAVDADADEGEPEAQLETARRRERRIALGWAVASVVLGLMLLMQLVHHNRQALARNSLVGPTIAGVYSAFGSKLSPEWNVRAYELRQFGAAADAGAEGTLRVRASLLNGAVHAQPYPVLRLTLQDRFGGRVGLRDLQPREYLQSAPARNALIGAGRRIDADIAIVDPGKDAVGFEIDVCLPASAGRLACANDAPRNAG